MDTSIVDQRSGSTKLSLASRKEDLIKKLLHYKVLHLMLDTSKFEY